MLAQTPASAAIPEPGSSLQPATLALPAGPGSVRGLAGEADLNVATGQVRYAMDIDLPSGINGLTPSIALLYDGALGNGVLGVGWSLQQPALARSLRHGVPRYSSQDGIEMHHLSGISGELIGAVNGGYTVEGQGDHVRVRRDGEGFIVEDGTGVTHWFGHGWLGRRGPEKCTSAWLLERSENTFGQQINYNYSANENERLLESIVWGPDASFEARLIYEDRPDVSSSYRTGFLLRQAKRVSRIEVRSHGQVVRSYRLQYTPGPSLCRLSQVTMLGSDGITAAPSSRFRYADARPSEMFALENHEDWRVGGQDTLLVDLEGKGISDYISLENGTRKRNLGGKFARAVKIPHAPAASSQSARLVDIDNDGRPELLVAGHDRRGWRVFGWEDNAWRARGSWPGSRPLDITRPELLLADVNGDGFVDAIDTLSGQLGIYLGGPNGFSAPFYRPQVGAAEAQIGGGGGAGRLVDVNGDGIVDIIGINHASYSIYLGRGDGSFAFSGRFSYPWGGGLTRPDDIHFVDLNRDGLVDLVYVCGGIYVSYYPGLPDGTFSSQAREVDAPKGLRTGQVAFGDINGNGSIDLIWPNGWATDLAGPTSAGMLTEIDNGLGLVTRFSYESAARLSMADEAAGRPWAHRTQHNIPVCTKIEHISAGEGQSSSQTLHVRDAVWAAEENRFAGFLQAQTTEIGDSPSTSLVTQVDHHVGSGRSRALRGRAHKSTTYQLGEASRPLAITHFSWRLHQPAALGGVAHPGSQLALLAEEITHIFERHHQPITTRTRHTYDQEGRRTASHALGRDDIVGDEAVRRWRYASSSQPWVRNVVTEERLENGDGAELSQTRYRYDAAGSTGQAPLRWGEVGNGKLREVTGLLHEEGRWVVLSTIDYDRQGRPTSTFSEGRRRHLTYDVKGLHPVQETLETGPDTDLTWRMLWDEVSGLPLQLEDPSGARRKVTYDPLGRPTSLALGDHAPHSRFSYSWRAPRSATLTYVEDGAAGRRVRAETFDGAGRPVLAAWQMEDGRWQVDGHRRYNRRGQLAELTVPYEARELHAAPPVGLAAHTFNYDALGRPLLRRLPTGAAQSWSYAPASQTLRQSDLAPVVRHSDGLGRLIRVERHTDETVEFADIAYDAASRPVRIDHQGGGAVQDYIYDGLGRLIAANDPDAGTWAQSWSDAGWLLSTQHAAGHCVRYRHDAAGRVISRSDGEHHYRYHYDRPAQAGQAYTAGRLAWAEDPTGATHFSYAASGQLAKVDRSIYGRRATRTFDYSPSGLLLGAITDGGALHQNSYDHAGRLAAVGGVWRCQKRSPAGGILEEHSGNGVSQYTKRDLLDLPVSTRLELAGKQDGMRLAGEYTSFGALSAVWDLNPGVDGPQTARFGYDKGARLTRAEVGDFSFDYAYDALQNLIARHIEGPRPLAMLGGDMTYGAPGTQGARQLKAVGTTAFAHDAAGRMVAAGDLRMSYDGFDQLREVGHLPSAGAQAPANASDTQDSGAAFVRHTYGYDGARAYSQGPDGTRRFFFADLTEHDGVREQQILVEGRPQAIVELSADGRQTNWRYQHSGLAPGASVITDTHGQMAQTRLFEPFGAAISGDFSLNRRSAANMPRDSLTGWSDHGARWQAPQFAGWLSVDRPSLAPSADAIAAFWDRHPYQVNRQNPNLFHDPDGNAVNLVTGAMGFAAGGVLGAMTQTGISLYRGETLSLRAIGSAAAGGAINGGIAGLTCGTSLLMEAGGIATGSAIGGMASRAITGDTITANSVAVDLGVGAVSFGLAKGGSYLSSMITQPTSMVFPTQLDRIHAIFANSDSRQALLDRVIKSSRLSGSTHGRITKGARSIAKKHGHGATPGSVSKYAPTKANQENAEILIRNIINNQEEISVTSKNVKIWSGDRGMWLHPGDLTFKTFLERRQP